MRRTLLGLLCLVLVLSCGVAPCHAQGGRGLRLVSYVYRTLYDDLPRHGWVIVEGRVSRKRLARILSQRRLLESRQQPPDLGPVVSITPISVSHL